jgi:uncharacterized protein (DUF885 family)
MTRFSHFAALCMAILSVSGCGAPPPPPAAAVHAAPPPEQLRHLLERYWDERIAYEDTISPQILADSLEVEKRFLEELESIPREALDVEGRLNYDIFRRQRETAIEGFTYPGELLPVNPFGGMPLKFAAAAAQSAESPLSIAQYDRWLVSVDDYVHWTRQAIANMQDGVLRGYTSPRALVERILPILERLGTDTPSNVFYTPLRSLPQNITAGDRERLSNSLRDAASQKLLPATRALHDYLQHDYLPKARRGLGMGDLPLGSAWYEYRVRRAVGPAAVPSDIHRIGLSELERLRPRLQALREQALHEPSAQPATSPTAATVTTPAAASTPALSDALVAYKDLGEQVTAKLPSLFILQTLPPYEILAADLPMPATPLYYRPAAPGANQTAVLFVNSLGLTDKPAVAVFLQQAIPGHHLQSATQQQRVDLPRFRRFGTDPEFVAGWGLYAATLGEELGMYSSDADKYQALNLQVRCAVALVVDTGLNSQGWTRAQALEYLRAQMSIEESDAESLIDEYAAMPGDALSCAMGASKLQALRSRAQQSLGARFDIREFHAQILKDGAMPLDILEAKLKAWIEASP